MGKEDEGEDEELLSEYSPSELSAILAEQDRMNGEEEESEEGSDDRVRLLCWRAMRREMADGVCIACAANILINSIVEWM